MGETPYIPFYTSDFLAGTSGMTAATKGVYITLLCMMYEAEGPLPQQWDTLARRCGSTLPAFKKAIATLEDDGKIELTEGGVWSNKCQKHIAQRRERQSSARAAAKTRWEKTQQKQRQSDASALRTQCQPEPEPYKEKEDNKLSSKNKRGCRLSEDWSLPSEWFEWAISDGWSREVVGKQADSFKDYWIAKPGQGGVKLDWFATWRNWMRNSREQKQTASGKHAAKLEQMKALEEIKRNIEPTTEPIAKKRIDRDKAAEIIAQAGLGLSMKGV